MGMSAGNAAENIAGGAWDERAALSGGGDSGLRRRGRYGVDDMIARAKKLAGVEEEEQR